jgi:4-amino-4-deoxy-L-arabinose transferase-like glycosyltransferase
MKKKLVFKIKPEIVLIIFILLISGFLRFYKLADNFVFGVDEEYQAYLAQTIIKDFHPIWIGVVNASVEFYLGPFWTYLTSGLLYFSKGNPLITGYFASFLGVITTLTVYLVGKKVFNSKVGFLASLLYACSPLIVFFDQKYWNVSPIPFLSLMMFFAVYSSSKNQKWWIVFSIAYGLVFHAHLSLAPLGLIGIYLFIKRFKKHKPKVILLSVLTFILTISPLLVFDYYHNFSNITFPLRLLSDLGDGSSKFDPVYKIKAFGYSLSRLVYLNPKADRADETNWGCTSTSDYDYFVRGENKDYWEKLDKVTTRTQPITLISVLFALLMLWFLIRRAIWQKDNTRLLAVYILIYFLSFILFPGNAYEYYLLGIFPLLFFIPGILLEKDNKPFLKLLIVALSFLLACYGVKTVVFSINSYGFNVKKEIISEVAEIIGNKPFILKSEGMCHIAEGWRYLYSYYGLKPVKSSTDTIFGWLYADEIGDSKNAMSVVMSEKRVPLNMDTADYASLSFGGFTAFISK